MATCMSISSFIENRINQLNCWYENGFLDCITIYRPIFYAGPGYC
jgi:hypothetical protein